jgi:hypothetical protein
LKQAYTVREETEVAIFELESKESCVRDLKTFRMMPWTSKLMYLSGVLFPLGGICVAYIKRTGGQSDARFWGWMAVLCWLGCALVIQTYIRGYCAERRGVAPAPPGERPDFEVKKRGMVLLCALMCLLTLMDLIKSIHHSVYDVRERWTIFILWSSLFFLYLSMYTRNRHWDIDLT